MGITIHFDGIVEDRETVDDVIETVREIAEDIGMDNEAFKEYGHVAKRKTRSMHDNRNEEEVQEKIERNEDEPYSGCTVETATREDIEEYGGPDFNMFSQGYEAGKAVIATEWSYTFVPESRELGYDKVSPSEERGIILNPSDHAESLRISFWELPDGNWKIDDFMKTQAFSKEGVIPNVKAHMFAVKLLMYLKEKFVPDLEIYDEADFYFTEEQREEQIERWKEHLNDPDSVYHDMAEETLEDWKTKKKFNPKNIVKSFGENLKVMKQMMGTLEDLGWDRDDMQIKQWIDDDSKPVESIKTIYSEDKAVDTVEKNGEEVMEIERDR